MLEVSLEFWYKSDVMTDEIKYWQSEDYEPNWDDFFEEWEAGNADYVNEWYYELDDCDDWEYPRNPFVKAVSEGRTSFAAQLTDFIEEGEEFYDMIMDFCAGDLDAMTLIIENSRWYKSDTIANIYEGLRNRETLRQSAREAAGNAAALQKQVEELQSDLEFYKNECLMKDEEINRLQEILDENGIDY